MNIQCHACQKVFEIEGSGTFLCPSCGEPNGWQEKVPPTVLLAWETQWKKTPFKAYVETLRALLLNPVPFFQALGDLGARSWWPMLIFALISEGLGFVTAFILNLGLSSFGPFLSHLVFGALPHLNFLSGFITLPFVLLFSIIIFPIFVLSSLFISAAITHLMAWLIIGTRKPFEVTLGVQAYSMGVHVLMLVPILGAIVAGIWQIILLIIGIKEAHQTTFVRACFVVLMPYLIFCGCVFSIVFGGIALFTSGIFGT